MHSFVNCEAPASPSRKGQEEALACNFSTTWQICLTKEVLGSLTDTFKKFLKVS